MGQTKISNQDLKKPLTGENVTLGTGVDILNAGSGVNNLGTSANPFGYVYADNIVIPGGGEFISSTGGTLTGALNITGSAAFGTATSGVGNIGSASKPFNTMFLNNLALNGVIFDGPYVHTTGDSITGNLTLGNTVNILAAVSGGSNLGSPSNPFGSVYAQNLVGPSGAYLNIAGGQMDGTLNFATGIGITFDGSGNSNIGEVTLPVGTLYVDNIVSNGTGNSFVLKAGDTMTGNLVMSSAGIRSASSFISGNSIALGSVTSAFGQDSVAFGSQTAALGLNSLALGNGSSAKGSQSVAMGSSAVASGTNSVAMGINSQALGLNSVAIGTSSIARGSNSLAMGENSESFGTHSVAMGDTNIASGNYSLAIGQANNALGTASLAGGQNSNARGIYSLAWGQSVDTGAGLDGTVNIADSNGSVANTLDNSMILSFENGVTLNSSTNLTHLLPESSGTNDIGSAALPFRRVYADELVDTSGASIYVEKAGDTMTGNLNFTSGNGITNNNGDSLKIIDNIGFTLDQNGTGAPDVHFGPNDWAIEGSNYGLLDIYTDTNGAKIEFNTGDQIRFSGDGMLIQSQALGVRLQDAANDYFHLDPTFGIRSDLSLASSSFGTIEIGSGVKFGPSLSSNAVQNFSAAFGSGNEVGINSSYYSMAIGQNNTIEQGGNNSLVVGESNRSTSGAYRNIIVGINNTGTNGAHDSIIAGTGNIITDGAINAIIGGSTNDIRNSSYNSLAVGQDNTITDGSEASIIGGSGNTISQGALNTLMIGKSNTVLNGSYDSLLAGTENSIYNSHGSLIAGSGNDIDSSVNSVAFGEDNTINTTAHSAAFGMQNSILTGAENSIVAGSGNNIQQTSFNTLMVGSSNNALAGSNDSLVAGSNNVITTAPYSVVGGFFNEVGGDYGVAFGTNVKVYGDSSGAFGLNSTVSSGSTNSFAFGSATASGTRAFAVGNSQALATDSFAVGGGVASGGGPAFAFGTNATAQGTNTVAMGYAANASGSYSIALGQSTSSIGQDGVAIGVSSQAIGASSMALGNTAKAFSTSSVALGNSALASGTSSIAIGNAQTYGQSSVALGGILATARGDYSLAAISATTWGDYAFAVGVLANASGNYSRANGVGAAALGQGTHVITDSQFSTYSSSLADSMHLRFQNGVNLSSGTDLLPISSGNSNLGSAALPFGTIYANEIVDTAGGSIYLEKAGGTMTGALVFASGNNMLTNESFSITSQGASQSISILPSSGLTIAGGAGDITVGAAIIPSASGTKNLGSTALPFDEVHANNIIATGINGQTAVNWTLNEVPTPITDGIETFFSLTNSPFSSDSVQLYKNGLYMAPSGVGALTIDYQVVSGNMIKFVSAPLTGTTLIANYTHL